LRDQEGSAEESKVLGEHRLLNVDGRGVGQFPIGVHPECDRREKGSQDPAAAAGAVTQKHAEPAGNGHETGERDEEARHGNTEGGGVLDSFVGEMARGSGEKQEREEEPPRKADEARSHLIGVDGGHEVMASFVSDKTITRGRTSQLLVDLWEARESKGYGTGMEQRLELVGLQYDRAEMPKQTQRAAAPQRRTKRPLRGSPEETRERLIDAAGRCFNREGYHGTDSNEIAKAAGYSPGTFYKHFEDKRAVFLAVYQQWSTAEWKAVNEALAGKKSATETATALVDLTIQFHVEWAGIRASLIELVLTDRVVRQFYREQRRRQLDLIAKLRGQFGAPARSREEDAIHLYTTERVYDAIAHGEPEVLGLKVAAMRQAMIELVLGMLR